jgi:hypothetical protein
MAAIILAAVFVVFFGLTFMAWRRYLWVADVLARISHQFSAAAGDAQHPAVLSHLGVLNVRSSTCPALRTDRKPSWAQHLVGLATKPGEKYGLGDRHLAKVQR